MIILVSMVALPFSCLFPSFGINYLDTPCLDVRGLLESAIRGSSKASEQHLPGYKRSLWGLVLLLSNLTGHERLSCV